jgi:hypothetical protein
MRVLVLQVSDADFVTGCKGCLQRAQAYSGETYLGASLENRLNNGAVLALVAIIDTTRVSSSILRVC